MAFTGYLLAVCCAVLFPVTTALYPNIRYNLTDSMILTCPQKFQSQLELLEQSLYLHVISHNFSHVKLVTSQPTVDWLSSALDCDFQSYTNVSQYKELNRQYHHHDARGRRSVTDTNINQWFSSYHNLDEIYNWFNDLAYAHPQYTEFVSIGSTQGNKQIYAFKLSSNRDKTNKRPTVYLQCLLHAREWITGPACMYTAYQLVSMIDNTERTSVKSVLSLIDIIIVPVANPDGYELTWMDYPKYRLWRKNRSSPSSTDTCQGVDLNRNFDIEWGKYGSSKDRCSETYHGVAPKSEKETEAISRLLENTKPIIGALDIHSYSQAILYPPAWTSAPGHNAQLLQTIAEEVAISSSPDTEDRPLYTSKQMGSIYLASGTFNDWINSEQFTQNNVDSNGNRYDPLPLTVELYPQDTTGNRMGFMVPPRQILPTCEEIFKGIQKYISLVVTNNNIQT